MKIIFYNHYHRGDIHYSRSFVAHTAQSIIEKQKDAEFIYLHRNSPDTAADIPHVREIANVEIPWHNKVQVLHGFDDQGEKVIAINTWVGSDNIFRGDCGCCFIGNQKLWNRIWEILSRDHGLVVSPPDDINDLLPKINYEKYPNCSLIDYHIKETEGKYRKRVFISNGPVLSNQAINFDFDPIIKSAWEKNTDCAFYLTDTTNLISPNIYKTRDLIGKDGCDLNENSYLSKFCDVLIGRGSGPFAFAGCYDNFMDESKELCIFANDIGEGAWHSKGKCVYNWCKSEDISEVQNIIDKCLGG